MTKDVQKNNTKFSDHSLQRLLTLYSINLHVIGLIKCGLTL